MEALVFGGSVIVSSSRRGHESNFLSHRYPLNFLSLLTKVFNYLLNAELVDNTYALA
jgi:hypothetical protein